VAEHGCSLELGVDLAGRISRSNQWLRVAVPGRMRALAF
jgi:hypothetical protein